MMSDLFNPELYVSDVSVYYGSKCAVQNVSFNIQPGQLTAIIGNNGCGKTSLIRAVMNFVKHSGKCMLGELQLESMSVRKRAGMISYIPQRNGISVSMTVRDVCLLGFNIHGRWLALGLRYIRCNALSASRKPCASNWLPSCNCPQ